LAEIDRLACTSLRGALPPLRRSLRCADCRGSACLSLSVTPGHLGTYGKPRFTPRAWAKFQVLGTYETTVMQPDHFRTRDAPDGRLGCGRLSPILATNSTFWSVCPSSVGIGSCPSASARRFSILARMEPPRLGPDDICAALRPAFDRRSPTTRPSMGPPRSYQSQRPSGFNHRPRAPVSGWRSGFQPNRS
jgi:hypothetical protein